ncbi:MULTISPECIES: polysaccharide export protein EpsE [Deefgea]|uniref:Polysaccharide export protein EpsE n=1 Tax=Deefgea chitinilytica TaxID=570276 RepID=A0ABS2CDW2_9NEIS|nr:MULTISPECIES: polysaccharide export protein EpsE [Deefgea]MBM5572341.1 polysaccharide export protein EpsE [Deefgea chitinilytica]MBM9889577.1 polysaccharide export protein EpsE [Deefgea sp. CFH1-16]
MIKKLGMLLCFSLLSLFAASSWAKPQGEYVLGPGDVVKIQVYDHPDLTTEVQLNNEGGLAFPLIGEVKLEGLDYTEAEALIAKKLMEGNFIKKPNVNVLIVQYRSQRVAVLGEVNKPGRYALDSATNIIDLLAIAGGISPAGGDTIVILRGEERIEYKLSKLTQLSNPEKRHIQIMNGDTVYVPRAQQFYVYGEVNRPGVFRLEPKMTMMQALSVAGGFNPRASHRSIEIHRVAADGQVEKIAAKLTDFIQENDTVFVQESLF